MSDTPDLTPKNTAPKEIFLQDAGDYESASQFEVTWCVDPQDDADTKYIRADLHEAERARADKAEAKLFEYKMVASAIDNQWAQEVEAARALTAERDALAKKLATARNDALEEAAQKVRADTFLITDHLRRIAAAIRAMKGNGNE